MGAFLGLSLYSIISRSFSTEATPSTDLKKEDYPGYSEAYFRVGLSPNMFDVRIEPDFWFYYLIIAESGRDFYGNHCCYPFQGECRKKIVAGVNMHDRSGGVF